MLKKTILFLSMASLIFANPIAYNKTKDLLKKEVIVLNKKEVEKTLLSQIQNKNSFSEKQLKLILDKMKKQREQELLLLKIAENSNIKNSKEYKKLLEKEYKILKNKVLLSVYMKELLNNIVISDKEVKEFYNDKKNIKILSTLKTVEFYELSFKNKKDADKFYKELTKTKKSEIKKLYQIKQKELQQQNFIFKDIVFDSLTPLFKNKIKNIKNDFILKPFEVNKVFVVIYFKGIKGGNKIPFNEIKDKIKLSLKNKKAQEKVQKLIDDGSKRYEFKYE